MPVAHFHVVAPTAEQKRQLLLEATEIYARELDSPVERIRVHVFSYGLDEVAVGGVLPSDPTQAAPFFTALVFAARPVQQRHAIIARFTDLLVDVLGVDRSLVRGQVVPIEADNWGIAGQPASVARAAELAARAAENPR